MWDKNINSFIQQANDRGVRMIMVGSGAMDYYRDNVPTGLDFWIEATSKNLNRIIHILQEMGSDKVKLPYPIHRKENMKVEFLPSQCKMELITNFLVDKSFSWAYDDSHETSLENDSDIKWRVISLEDLIDYKSKSFNPQDLIDLKELKRLEI